MTTYIDIDTNPDPDCCEAEFVIYLLYPPGDEAWALTWHDDDDSLESIMISQGLDVDKAEQWLCETLDVRRSCSGEYASEDTPLPDNFADICEANDIVINKIGQRLNKNC